VMWIVVVFVIGFVLGGMYLMTHVKEYKRWWEDKDGEE